jgi:hypothetical protein
MIRLPLTHVNTAISLFINSIRDKVDQWRNLPDNNDWKVSPTTRDLLTYWRLSTGQKM